MKIILIYPPFGDLTQVYPSLPYLAAFLKENGCDVIQKDVNIEAYDALLSVEKLKKSYEVVSKKIKGVNQYGTSPKMRRLKLELQGPAATAKYAIDNIEKAKSVLRSSRDFYNYKKYLWARLIIDCAVKLISAEYHPTVLGVSAFSMRYSSFVVTDILRATEDEKENPFLDFFKEDTLPFILQQKPAVVGISLVYDSQIIPALTLAKLIKEHRRDIHITIGGPVVSWNNAQSLLRHKKTYSIIDSVVTNDGERALLKLIRQLEGNGDFSSVPNLIFYDSRGIHTNSQVCVEDINSLPAPSFEGVPFPLYFSPAKVLPLPITRGCYWKRCAFCTYGHSEVTRNTYRERDVSLIIKDITYLSRKYKTKYFFFSVDVASPALLDRLASMLLEKKIDIRWQTDARLEKLFNKKLCLKLYRSGCRNISFGLESGCQRILEMMQKGTRIKDVQQILKNCRLSGIAVNLGIIIGFLTEKREEAVETLEFVLKNKSSILSVSCSCFGLVKGSQAYNYPERYGIVRLKKNIRWGSIYSYDVKCGMDMHEARKMFLYARRRLSIFPAFTFPFNGEDAHTLLYLSRYGSIRFRKLATKRYNSLMLRDVAARMRKYKWSLVKMKTQLFKENIRDRCVFCLTEIRQDSTDRAWTTGVNWACTGCYNRIIKQGGEPILFL